MAALPISPDAWVPEHELFAPGEDRPRLLARGWRAVLLNLAVKKLVSLEKAKKIFSRSLGETDYDRLDLQSRWLLQGHRPRFRKDLFSNRLV